MTITKTMKPNGVCIYISWKEYLSICRAMSEISSNMEAADEEYSEGCERDLTNLNNVKRKFKRAKWIKDNK